MPSALHMILPSLVIADTKNKGRGVFASEPITKGTIIEIAPVIVMNGADRTLIDKTLLHDYIFEWGAEKEQCCMALGYVPIYNHESPSNCEYTMDYEHATISITAMQDINAGEELTINYNGDWDNQDSVWFNVKE